MIQMMHLIALARALTLCISFLCMIVKSGQCPIMLSTWTFKRTVQAARQAYAQLALIDAEAASGNDLTQLFVNRDEFPEVFQRQAELATAQSKLQDLLPMLAKRIGVAKLSYTSVQNQVRSDNVHSTCVRLSPCASSAIRLPAR